ncbi:glycosyltransferase [Aurantiacibacter poecillastricola]|uniref:glycosyltransferase n=1 Tax=Aurantiacibacter poecillastricola TaxID=3064385 RepID=UPI00273E6A87|nr:glycosyltransferase [Aurantiacibacter sp. 219JJ12-13]MDP5263061.1 glycosyltransferase [Aurantiacibacter sp. 219JJ12-13]
MTATTSSFIPGTVRMLVTFLKHHPQFDGPLIIVSESLSREERRTLEAISPRVVLREIGEDLKERIAAVTAALPALYPTRGRFYSIEALRPDGFDELLFVDSDILFIGSVADIFGRNADCCGVADGCHLRGFGRHPDTFAEVARGRGILSDTFNAGLMLFGPGALTGTDFDAVLERLSPAWFEGLRCGLHDQSLYNRQFAGRTLLLDSRFNFLLRHRALLLPGVKLGEVKALHFNVSPKPWHASIEAAPYAGDPLLAWAWKQWNSDVAPGIGTIA